MVDIVSIRMGDMIGHGLWFTADILPHRSGPYSTYFSPSKSLFFSPLSIKNSPLTAQRVSRFSPLSVLARPPRS